MVEIDKAKKSKVGKKIETAKAKVKAQSIFLCRLKNLR